MSPVTISIKMTYFVLQDCFILVNSTDPIGITFHLGLQCLPKYVFIGLQNKKGLLTGTQELH